jgi:hypothetical protein
MLAGDEDSIARHAVWLMGDLSFASFSPVALCLLAAVGGLAIAAPGPERVGAR